MACCAAMQHAIENGYVQELHTYTDNRVRSSLGIYVRSENFPHLPSLKLNLCPWCASQLTTQPVSGIGMAEGELDQEA